MFATLILAYIPKPNGRRYYAHIINVLNTITFNPNQNVIGNVLIIDDATGSGATLYETAKKIKNIAEKKD